MKKFDFKGFLSKFKLNLKFNAKDLNLKDLQKNVTKTLTSKINAKQKNANLVYYNPDSKIFLTTSGGKVIQYTKGANSSLRVVSLINFDSLLKTNVEVPRTTDDMDIEDFVIETAYKQLNIAADADYQVSYSRVEANFDADNWIYDVYAIESKNLENIYDDLVAKTTFLDVVTTTAFLPLALYKKGKLDVIDNHIFVFIGEDSGIFAFYSKGEPVYIKTLNSNMHRLRVEFNQETSLELSASEFEDFLAGKAAEANDHKASIDSMVDRIAHEVEENVLYIKRVYQDLDPTAIYFGMSCEYDSRFLPIMRDTLLLDARPFNQLAFVSVEKGRHALANIAMHYADLYISNMNIKIPNFSYAKRPKPLSQRESGQFVLIVAACFVLSLINPIYNVALSGFYNFRAGMLQSEHDNVVFPKAEDYRNKEKNMKAQIESLQQTQANLNQTIANLRGDMSDIHTWQVGYIQKTKIVDDILKVAKDSKVSIVKYTATANNNQSLVVTLHLFAKNQQDITDFIRNLNSQKTYKSVTTEKIEKYGVEVTTDAQTSMASVAKNTANAARTTARTATATATNQAENLVNPEYSFSNNADLESRVTGYLNSIVKVVVR